MNTNIVENPNEIQINEIREKLQDFNAPYWEITNKDKYVITLFEEERLMGGMVFTIFGDWLPCSVYPEELS